MTKGFITKNSFAKVAVALLLVVSMFFAAGCSLKPGTTDAIAKGVSVAGVELGGMTKAEAVTALKKLVPETDEIVLSFVCGDKNFDVSGKELSLKANVEKTADAAYAVGRGKDEEENKSQLKLAKTEGIKVIFSYTFDEDKLALIVGEQCADKVSDPSPMNVEIGTDCLIVTNAVAGMVVNMDKAKTAIEKELSDFKADNTIELFIEEYTPENLTFEEFKKEYLREAKDAVYTKKGEEHIIEPEVVGIEFDVEEAKKIFEANKTSAEAYKIPAVITNPEVTASYLEDKYVNNVIATYSTSFAGSAAGRIANIELASSKINGYVLNPGERFSYNNVVGPRTAAAGFKMAHVYVGNQVVDGIGGGICQVSSTLYNAIVLADLKTVSRTNHSMPVSYVPMGRDATVSYGTIDFVFENNKSYPVSIKSVIEGTTLKISIVGASSMDYTVEFVSSYNSAIPFGTVNVDDDTLPAGEQKVITAGSNGSVYDSYRVYKKDGVEYDRKYESKSRYQPSAQKIAVGTGVGIAQTPDNAVSYTEPSSAPVVPVPETHGSLVVPGVEVVPPVATAPAEEAAPPVESVPTPPVEVAPSQENAPVDAPVQEGQASEVQQFDANAEQ